MKILCFLLLNLISLSAMANTQIIFSHDGRPYDGVLTEITFTQLPYSQNFSATLRTAYFSRKEHTQIDHTELLAANLSCQFAGNTSDLMELNCSIDARPSDGALIEVIVQKQENGFYNAILHKNQYSRIEHREIDTVDAIGSNLEMH